MLRKSGKKASDLIFRCFFINFDEQDVDLEKDIALASAHDHIVDDDKEKIKIRR